MLKLQRQPRLSPVLASLLVALLLHAAPSLASRDDTNSCIRPPTPVVDGDTGTSPDKSPAIDRNKLLIQADTAEIIKSETTIFRGNVKVHYVDRTLLADEASYHRPTAQLKLTGNVRIESADGDVFQSSSAEFNTSDHSGMLTAGTFYFSANQSRGNASEIVLNPDKSIVLNAVKFTTCPADNESWSIFFRRLALDPVSDNGIGRHAVLRLGKVPVFYTPYLRFPLGNRRQSGLLVPGFGESDQAGTSLRIPYYLNLAPNYDATLTTNIMSRRGVQAETEFRYLGKTLSGLAEGRYLPSDRVSGVDRGYAKWNHRQQLTNHLYAGIQAEAVSDVNYFTDLGRDLQSNPTHLTRQAQLRYQPAGWSIDARAVDYQVLDTTLAANEIPYRRLPQVDISLHPPLASNKIGVSMEIQYSDFDHPTQESARRVNVDPAIHFPLTQPWGYLDPAIRGHFISYQERSVGSDTQVSTAAVTVDSGLLFERRRIPGSGWTRTLEPRAFFVYSPYIDQSSLPVFDTAEAEPNLDNLFRANRFIGGDRVGDDNRVTLALSTRWFDQDDNQRFRLGIAQSMFFEDRQVVLPPALPTTGQLSDTVLEATANFGKRTYFRSTWSGNPETGSTVYGRQFLQYQPDNGRILNLGYRYYSGDGESIDLSGQWRFNQRWSSYSRVRYHLGSQTNLSSYAGFLYRSCCWSLQLTAGQQVDRNGDQQRSAQFLLTLSGFGSNEPGGKELPLGQSVFFDR